MIKLQNNYFFLRHGESSHMAEKPHMCYPAKGSLNKVCLTKKGRKQIKEIASKLKKKNIDLIYSSDFLRTKQTSLIVAKEIGIKKEEITFSTKLRDVNLGIYHNGTRERYKKEMGTFPESYEKKPQKGESLKNVKKRMVNSLKEIDKKHKEKNILIIGHGHPLWLLEAEILGIEPSDMMNGKIKKNYIQVGELRNPKTKSN